MHLVDKLFSSRQINAVYTMDRQCYPKTLNRKSPLAEAF
jgi:hypothetical protein